MPVYSQWTTKNKVFKSHIKKNIVLKFVNMI